MPGPNLWMLHIIANVLKVLDAVDDGVPACLQTW